jgi:hypothetical protein
MNSIILFQDQFHRIEHHFTSSSPSIKVACTFTPFNFYKIDNDGFGVPFLLARGYDAISFKCTNDSWFQQIPNSALVSAGDVAACYEHVVT